MASNSEFRKRHEERDSDNVVTPDDSEIAVRLSRRNVHNLAVKLKGLIGWQGEVCDACVEALDADG